MSFDNCSQAYAAGRANIPKTDPAYAKKLDRDNDGVACDQPPAGFKPAGEQSSGDKSGSQAGTSTSTKTQREDQLPQTGPAMDLGIAGAVILTAGLIATMIARRRRMKFTA